MATRKTATAKTPTGVSLHLGLNAVDPRAYGGWSGELNACENDARDMAALALERGFKPTTLLTRKATRAALLKSLRSASDTLRKGDIFLLTYSGHGGQVPDTSGDEGDDKQDETWCLYDGQLIDDELYFELSRFVTGVRVLVLSDSCHSGTVTRERLPDVAASPDSRSRQMPPDVARRTYQQHQAFYDKLQRDVAKAAGAGAVDPDEALAALQLSGGRVGRITRRFRASVLLISGCQDNQTSLDGPHNGAFTGRLLQVWAHGRYVGDYRKFHAAIVTGMPATQTPNLFGVGPVTAFAQQQPFSVVP